MAFDFKKEYKAFYLPPKKPGIIQIPKMNYIAVRGHGDPNVPDGEYKAAIGLLYGIAFTIKMSYKGTHKIEGYFPYVVPPLEGLWWQNKEALTGTGSQTAALSTDYTPIDYTHKESFHWTAMIRLPDFVTRDVFDWAVREATEKKKMDFSKAEFFTYDEGLCVQCMHIGSYDNEPVTLQIMNDYAAASGYVPDFSARRLHHEIYLSDPRRTAQDKLRTVIRHPVRRCDSSRNSGCDALHDSGCGHNNES